MVSSATKPDPYTTLRECQQVKVAEQRVPEAGLRGPKPGIDSRIDPGGTGAPWLGEGRREG